MLIVNNGSINKLFKVESKIMVLVLIAPVFIGLLLAFILPILMEEVDIDSCLDAGGSFNYEECKCDFNTSHVKPDKYNCN